MSEQTETMEQPMEQPIAQPVSTSEGGTIKSYPEVRKGTSISPQAGGGGCGCGAAGGMGTNGAGMASVCRCDRSGGSPFSESAAEKEFAQVTGRADTAGKTDQRASTPCCSSVRTATLCVNYVGY